MGPVAADTDRAQALAAYAAEHRGVHALPARRGPHAGRLRRRRSRRRPDVRRRGARASTRTSRASRSSARPGSCSTGCSPGSASAATASTSRTCSSAARPGNRDPQPDEIEACEAHLFRQVELVRPMRRRHARELRHEAPLGQAARDHARPRLGAGDDPRRPPRAALPALPPGGRALHAEDARGARGRLPRASRSCSRASSTRRPPPRSSSPPTSRRTRPPRSRPSRAGPARPLLAAHPYASRWSSTPPRPTETEESRGILAHVLLPGDVVTVSGELGAGKTTFVRGACRALGVTDHVTSPTFTIGHRYHGRLPVSHLDLYRFQGVSAAEWGDLEPYFEDAIASSSGRRPARACCRAPAVRGRFAAPRPHP